jgi:hypothetical protein
MRVPIALIALLAIARPAGAVTDFEREELRLESFLRRRVCVCRVEGALEGMSGRIGMVSDECVPIVGFCLRPVCFVPQFFVGSGELVQRSPCTTFEVL